MRIKEATDYRDLLLEILALEEKIFGSEEPKRNIPTIAMKVDRGKVMALHRAGWTGRKIAEEMGCTDGTISKIISKELYGKEDKT